jgi:predicted NBD/HSP70 family sugar kinase
LVDLSGNIGLQRSDIIADNHEYFNETLTIIMDAQKNYGTQILGVCIVIPAMISQFTEKIYSTSLDFSDEDAHWAFMQLQRMDVGYPVTVLNDTACIAYAEKIYTHIPDKNYVYIFFDRGIGATIFIDDKMIGRANGSFTQFGHISIDRNGRLCQCGNRGCIENYICESNLSTLYKELDPSASCLIASYAELKKLVDAGDQTAIRVISNISEELAQVLRNVICLVNPSLIVLGGKSRDLGESFIELLQDELHRQGFAQMTDYVTVRFNILNDQALYVGAMRYHFDTYYNFIKLNEKQVEFG